MLKKFLSLTMALCMMLSASCVLADDETAASPYMKEATAAEKEAGILGYQLSNDFNDGKLGDRIRNIVASAIDTFDGAPLSSKAMVAYFATNANITYQAVSNFKSATTSNYVMLEADFMIPDVAAEGKDSYAGGVASVALGWTFTANYATPSTNTGAVTTSFNITGNRGNSKGSVSFKTANCDSLSTSRDLTYSGIDITPDVWHKVEILADTKAKHLDFYLDGKLLIMDVLYGAWTCPGVPETVGLRSACLGVSEGKTSTQYTKGQLLGTGRATEDGETTYNPYPVLWDNLNVMEVTPAFVAKKVESGYKALLPGGRMYNPTMLPAYGRVYPNDISVTYSVDNSQAIVDTSSFKVKNAYGISSQDLTRPADTEVSNSIENKIIPQLAAVRKSRDLTGYFTVTYTKDAGETPDPNYDINYTFDVPVVLRANVAETAIENISANNMYFYVTDKGIDATVEMQNAGETDFEAIMLLCTYKGNQMTEVDIVPVSVKAGIGEVTLESAVDVNTDDTEVKAFVWVMNTLVPVSYGELQLAQ